ncbi:MAG: hypothetical protein RL660_1466 [Bacteroidota bacterium]|jgi:hypothetical protein
MNTNAINRINDRLKQMPDTYADQVLEFLNYLDFKTSGEHFELSDEQKALLDKRRAIPDEEFIPADKFLDSLRKQYGL